MKRSIQIKMDEFKFNAISVDQQKNVKGGEEFIIIEDTVDG